MTIPQIIEEPIIAPEVAELRTVTAEVFERTELSRLSELCGFTEEGYQALLDDVAQRILAAGYTKAATE